MYVCTWAQFVSIYICASEHCLFIYLFACMLVCMYVCMYSSYTDAYVQTFFFLLCSHLPCIPPLLEYCRFLFLFLSISLFVFLSVSCSLSLSVFLSFCLSVFLSSCVPLLPPPRPPLPTLLSFPYTHSHLQTNTQTLGKLACTAKCFDGTLKDTAFGAVFQRHASTFDRFAKFRGLVSCSVCCNTLCSEVKIKLIFTSLQSVL